MNPEVPSSIEVNKAELQAGLNSNLEALRAMEDTNALEVKQDWFNKMLEGIN